ncbi:MAG: ferrous iron transport protein B [Clostridiales bacterium]|nr:ferrous iron transport protein B [Clostridiales bacterium]
MKNRIALLGQPNSGKSTVFNALTGSRQHVGNWPGKTVEKNDGEYKWQGKRYVVTDLPGSYGLTGNSDEELITTGFIREKQADLVCILVDASQLERSMFMVAEFAQLDTPAVLLLNMMDVAKTQGKEIDTKLLEKRLGIPVLPFVAAESTGYEELRKLFAKELERPHMLCSAPELPGKGGAGSSKAAASSASAGSVQAESEAKFKWISSMLEGVTHSEKKHFQLSKRDQRLLSPVKGKFLCFGIVLLGFLAAMIICMPLMGVGAMIPYLLNKPITNLLNSWNVHPWLVSIFSILIPNTLYFCVAMSGFIFGVNFVFGYLEEIGFLARAAYQFDNLLSGLGLQGKAVCPILMGFGCTMGGASGTRVMDSWGQRMLTMAVVWAVPCASIWTIVPVIGSMFFNPWQTMLIVVGILLYVIILMVIVSKVFGRKLLPANRRSGMIMELPPYHKPHWKHIAKEALMKAFDLFKRALRTVTLISLLFWIFSYSNTGDVADSLLYKVGTTIEPVTRLFGLGWRTFMGFLSSAFAKEAVLGVLNAVFVGSGTILDATFRSAFAAATDNAVLSQAMTETISKAEALAFICACTFNIPCVMALSTTYRESHSLKWTARIAAFYVCGALILSCIVYHIAVLFI